MTSRDQRGTALVGALLTSVVALGLGVSLLVTAEMEAQQSRAFTDRGRARAAAEGAVRLAASWLATPDAAVGLPAPQEWITDRRRGDSDLDGVNDDACNGSLDGGRWAGFPLVPAGEGPALAELVGSACGDAEAPDLLLQDGPALARLSASLGSDVVVERLAIFAGPERTVSRSVLTVQATVGVKRGRMVVSRVTAVGRMQVLPRLSGAVVAADGDVEWQEGARVAWGTVRSGGDVRLPALLEDASPRSGLPRAASTLAAGWATGSATDWNLGTNERECLLTELLGRTVQGRLVLTPEVVAPTLPDPWLTVIAAGALVPEGDLRPSPRAEQPWPYDPRVTTVQDDLSFLSAHQPLGDQAVAAGALARLAELAQSDACGGPRLRRFILSQATGSEPRWTEGGLGAERTAEEWLASMDAPGISVFLAGGAPRPKRVVMTSPRGIVLVEAGEVVLRSPDEPSGVEACMPGEPFFDRGIDADGDGEIDPGTAANGRWDADLDGDRLPDEMPEGLELADDVGPRYFLPHRDEDVTRRAIRPHEAYLNFAWPADMVDAPVSVDFRFELERHAAPVEDVDGNHVFQPGRDAFTSLGRDDRGARVLVPAHAHALVANLAGDVVVAEGYELLGAVHATGQVVLEPRSVVRLDERLAREGRLSLPLPEAVLTAVAFPRQGVATRRGMTVGAPPDADTPPSSTPAPGAGGAGAPQRERRGSDDGAGPRARRR